MADPVTAGLGRVRESPELWSYDPMILAGLARGHTAAEIAASTGTPEGTVRNRLMRLRRRIGAHSSAHAVAIAYRRGWLAALRPEPRLPVNLSGRQRTVLALIADGRTNTQIAQVLGVAPDTAATHIRRLYAALGASRPCDAATPRRAHAVALAYQHGHLPLSAPRSSP